MGVSPNLPLPNVTYPPDSRCWLNDTLHFDASFTKATRDCSPLQPNPTGGMVDFLNLTSDYSTFIQAYCLNPSPDDSCAYGYCPNPDVAGVLTRLSIYISSFCLALLIFYADEPEEVSEAFWSQTLTLLSIIVSAAISISENNLTKLHAVIAAQLVMSPLTLFLGVYSIRGIFGHKSRVDHLLGRGQILKRVVALGTIALWLGFFVYTLIPTHLSNFSQPSCDGRNFIVKWSFLAPIIYVGEQTAGGAAWVMFLAVLPLLSIVGCWGTGIYLRRKQLWYRSNGTRQVPGFWTVWRMIGVDFPLVHFLSVVVVPFVLWILAVELGIKHTSDNHFQASFGQVLAIFVTIPPLISVARLLPRFWRWFVNLTWVRYVTGRPQQRPFAQLRDERVDLLADDTLPLPGGEPAPAYHDYPTPASRKGSFESRRGMSFDSMQKAAEPL